MIKNIRIVVVIATNNYTIECTALYRMGKNCCVSVYDSVVVVLEQHKLLSNSSAYCRKGLNRRLCIETLEIGPCFESSRGLKSKLTVINYSKGLFAFRLMCCADSNPYFWYIAL